MVTDSFNAMRRFAAFAFTLLLFSLCLCAGAGGQQGASPLVTSSVVTGLPAPPTFGAVWASAVSSHGDFVIHDFQNAAVYQYPAGGGAPIKVFASGSSGPGGGWANAGIAIDKYDNMLLDNNWNGGMQMVPYSTANNTWNTSAKSVQGNLGPFGSGYYQAVGLAANANGTVVMSSECCSPGLMSWTQDATGNITNYATVIQTTTSRARALALDNAGNIFIFQDGGLPGILMVPAGVTGLANDKDPHVLRVDPVVAGSSPASWVLSSITGMAVDAAGNLYVGDSGAGVYMVPNQGGTLNPAAWVMITPVPATGQISIDQARDTLYIPTKTLWNGIKDIAAVSLGSGEFGSSPVGTQSATPISVYYSFSGPVTPAKFIIQENGATTPDFTIVSGGNCAIGTTYPIAATASSNAVNSCTQNIAFNPQHLGRVSAQLLMQAPQPVTVGSPGSTASISKYSASGNILTLTATNNFVPGELISISDSKTGTLYPLNGQSFSVLPTGLSASQFEIQTTTITGTGNSTATATGLFTYPTVATTVLHGIGLAGAIQATPALESATGGGLNKPSQVATDAMGNLFVADAGLGKVLMYAGGSGGSPASIGTGLTAPTGVAVDGAGDVFIADNGSGANAGTVYEIPFGPSGLNAAGQLTLVGGLGTNLRLAADGLGHLFVADPDNKRVVELYNLAGSNGAFGQSEVFLTAGFTAPSYVALDASNNLYVIDGSNLFEISNGSQSTLLNTLSNATAVAVDPSGAVYVASSGGTVRIPNEAGALAPADQAAIAQSVTNPAGLAIDYLGNIYLVDGSAGNIHVVSTSSTLNFGILPTTSSTATLPATIINEGNAPLTITGYPSNNPIDYTGTDVSCLGTPIAAGGTCMFDVTLNPGPGEQGTLVGQIGIQNNGVNGPIGVNATGVGAALAGSVSSITVGSSPEVVNAPVTVTVKQQSGTTVPTGDVVVTFPSFRVIYCPGTPNSPPPCTPAQSGLTIFPATGTMTGTLANGTVKLALSPVMAGSNAFTVKYIGDRVYGRSTGTSSATVAKSAIASLTLPPNPPSFMPYVLESFAGGGQPPYDTSSDYWQYKFTVQVNTSSGQPTGTVTFMDQWQAGASSTLTTGQACPKQSADGMQALDVNGKATFPASCLPMPQNVTYTPIVSTHIITPVYSGDANFQGFTGQPTTFIAVRSPAVSIASSPASLTVTAGSPGSVNLTLTSILGYGFAGKNQQLNDYNFPVSLACDNLPPHASCSFTYPTTVNPNQPSAPNSVQIPCTGTTSAADNCLPGTATVTINTNVAVGTTTAQLDQPAPITFAVMFGFGMIGLCFRRRIGRKGRLLLVLCLSILSCALAVSLTACSTTNLSPASVLTTPKGTYAVTITAQQVGSQLITLPNTGPIPIYGSQNQVSLPFTINLSVQ